MFNSIFLHAGSLRQAAEGVAIKSYNEGTLDDLLTSGWFWGIVVFILFCVGVAAVVNGNKK